MDPIKKHERSITLTHTCELLHKEVEPGLTVYRMTNSATAGETAVPKAFESKVGTHTTEGIAETKDVESYLNGQASSIKGLEGHYEIVSESFLEEARTKGFHDATEALKSRQDYYKAFAEEGIPLERLVIFDYGNYVLYDRHNGVLPVAELFDYMHGHFHNGRYDLEKALTVLRANPAVRFVPHERRWDGGRDDEILKIPYYNVDDEHQTHLSFMFSPTLEQEQAIWAKQQSYGSRYPSTEWYRAVEDLDLLGMRAAGARLPEKTYDE